MPRDTPAAPTTPRRWKRIGLGSIEVCVACDHYLQDGNCPIHGDLTERAEARSTPAEPWYDEGDAQDRMTEARDTPAAPTPDAIGTLALKAHLAGYTEAERKAYTRGFNDGAEARSTAEALQEVNELLDGFGDAVESKGPTLAETEGSTPAEALDVDAMTETLRYLYHADQPCDRPDEHRHDHMARGIVGQYPRLARLRSPESDTEDGDE